jgi:hypothetical protein
LKRITIFIIAFADVWSNLSNTQLQRLVLLEQLQVLQMEKEKLVCKQDASFSSATTRIVTESEGKFLHL